MASSRSYACSSIVLNSNRLQCRSKIVVTCEASRARASCMRLSMTGIVFGCVETLSSVLVDWVSILHLSVAVINNKVLSLSTGWLRTFHFTVPGHICDCSSKLSLAIYTFVLRRSKDIYCRDQNGYNRK